MALLPPTTTIAAKLQGFYLLENVCITYGIFYFVILCREKGFCCEADTDDSNTMNKKVRNAQLAQFNFIFGKELES